jgi:DedD protein
MAFFKFRLPGQSTVSRTSRDTSGGPVQSESVEAMRRRARHRLIGAAVLVLAAVIGFPLLFDTQPRPVAVDVPISIPDRNKARPLTIPATPPETAPRATSPSTASAGVSGQVTPAASLDAKEEMVSSGVQAAAPVPVPVPTPAPSPAAPKAEPPAAKVPAPAEAKPVAKSDDGSKARALLDGKASDQPAAAADAGRIVVQVGAFSDPSKAREVRLKVERAGLKTYTQVVETPDGKRIRVRVGPFASKAEADKAATRIKGLDLPAAILTL